jgi:hypothetical protein
MDTTTLTPNGQPQATPTQALQPLFNAREVVQTLHDLMTKVTAQEVSSNTVNAACNCAARICDLLRLHLDAERLRRLESRHTPM